MPLNNLGLGFVFTARDLASGTINRVGGAFGALDRNALRASQSYHRNIAVMGAGLAIMGAGAATIAGAFALADQAGVFEQSIARVGALARSSAEDLGLLHDRAIEVGIATMFSPTQAAEGLENLASMGFSAAESMALIMPAAQMAEGGAIEIGDAAQAMASATRVFGLSMDETGAAADRMLAISNLTALRAGDMSNALGTVARGASLTRQSLDEMLISMGMVRDTGVDTSVAASSVSSALVFMANRSADFAAMGVHITDAQGAFRPFLDIVQESAVALGERYPDAADRAAHATALFSRFGLTAFSAVERRLAEGVRTTTGEIVHGTAAIAYMRHEMELAGRGDGREGAAAEFQRRLLDTFAGQQRLLHGSMETLGIVVGEGFTRGLRPYVEQTINIVNRAIGFFQEIPIEVRGAMAAVVIGGAGLMFVMGGVVAMGAAIALIAPFIGAIATATIGLVAAMSPFVALFAVGVEGIQVFTLLMAQHQSVANAVNRTWTTLRLGFRALVQLFTTGELSGAVAREMSAAENGGLLRFVVNIYALGFRVMQVYRGMQVGFQAVTARLGPSLAALGAALGRLGRAFGFVDEAIGETVTGSSSRFLEVGARIGAWFGGIVDLVIRAATTFAEFSEGVVSGVHSGLELVSPILDEWAPMLTFVGNQFSDLLAQLGMVGPQTSGWRLFGSFVGGFLVGALTGVSVILQGLTVIFGGIVWAIARVVEGFHLMRLSAQIMGVEMARTFGNVGDYVSNLGDRMVAGMGRLASAVPAGVRPAELESVVQAGQAAQQRIDARPAARADRDARATALEAVYTAQAGTTAVAAQTTQAARTDAALDAVHTLLARQIDGRERETRIAVQIDGATIAEATARADRAGAAAGFAPVGSET